MKKTQITKEGITLTQPINYRLIPPSVLNYIYIQTKHSNQNDNTINLRTFIETYRYGH